MSQRHLYNKLIRDLIPERMDSKNVRYDVRVASDEEFSLALTAKLSEEIWELIEAAASGDQKKVVLEAADVKEVMDSLNSVNPFFNKETAEAALLAVVSEFRVTLQEIEHMRQHRFQERGGFSKRLILLWTETN